MRKVSQITWWHYLLTAIILFVLMVISVTIGTGQMSLSNVIAGRATPLESLIFSISRIPRTISVVLSGMSLSIAGLIMQSLVQNKFVEPATTGVSESACLGLLVATIWWPDASLMVKMLIGLGFALAGTALLMTLVRQIGQRQSIVVPLIGIILSGIIGAFARMLAWEYELQGALHAWRLGDFSGVLKGRYELIYLVIFMAVVAYVYADRFTIAALGRDAATSLGLNYRRVSLVGLAVVAFIASVTLVVVGTLPFLGIVVPNIVSWMYGDYMRQSLPIVAMGGAIFVLICDIISRVLIMPAEVPVGVVIGVLGSFIFLMILARLSRHQQSLRKERSSHVN